VLPLNDSQAEVLRERKLSVEHLFDAQGMEREQFLAQARLQGKIAFAPQSPCSRGHVFWLGSGHCIQCQPVGLTTWRKFYEDGLVYIASSEKLRLHQIGATKTRERPRQLREGYGGAKDWIVTYLRQFRRHGRVSSHGNVRQVRIRESARESLQAMRGLRDLVPQARCFHS
jgi:hypothetical protein